MGDTEDVAMDEIKVQGAVVKEATLKIGMTSKIEVLAMVSHKETFSMAEDEVKIIHTEGNKTSGVEMTPTTVTGIIGIEIPTVKVILIGAEDGTIIIEVKDIVIREEGEDGTLIHNIMTRDTNIRPNSRIRITIAHHRWDSNIATRFHIKNIHIPNNNSNTRHK